MLLPRIFLRLSAPALLVFSLLGCRTHSEYAQTKDALPDQGSQTPIDEPQSIFDRLMAQQGGVPFPFEKLVEAVGHYAVRTRIEPLALGRSLQKMAGDPDFFKRPRFIVAFAGENFVPDATHFPVAGRVFLGHVPNTDQVEVISWNAVRAGFDFELINNYASTGSKIVHPAQELCTACHQHAIPILEGPFWPDFDASQRLRLAADSPLGTLMAHSGANPSNFDGSIRQGADFAEQAARWAHLCGAEQLPGCRAVALARMVQQNLRKSNDGTQFEPDVGVNLELADTNPIVLANPSKGPELHFSNSILPSFNPAVLASKAASKFKSQLLTAPPPADDIQINIPDHLIRQVVQDFPVLGVVGVAISNTVTADSPPTEAMRAAARQTVVDLAAQFAPNGANVHSRALTTLSVRWAAAPLGSWFEDALDLIDATRAHAAIDNFPPSADPKAIRDLNLGPITVASFQMEMAEFWRDRLAKDLAFLPMGIAPYLNGSFALVSSAGAKVENAAAVTAGDFSATSRLFPVSMMKPTLPNTEIGTVLPTPSPAEKTVFSGKCKVDGDTRTCDFSATNVTAHLEIASGAAKLGMLDLKFATGPRAGLHRLACSFVATDGVLACSPFDWAKLNQAVIAMRDEATATPATGIFASPIYREDSLLSDVEKHLGLPSPSPCCDEGGAPTEPVDDPIKILKALTTNKSLKVLVESCAACHSGQSDELPIFIGGKDQKELCEMVAAKKIRIVKRITSTTNPMPPQASTQAKNLLNEERTAVKALLETPDFCAGLGSASS